MLGRPLQHIMYCTHVLVKIKKVILLCVQLFHNFSYLSVKLLKDKGELDITDEALIGKFLDIHVPFLLLCYVTLFIVFIVSHSGPWFLLLLPHSALSENLSFKMKKRVIFSDGPRSGNIF